MCRALVVRCGILALAMLAPGFAPSAQTVSSTAGAIVPFVGMSGSKPSGKFDASDVALYATAFLGPAGSPIGLPDSQQARSHYATLHLVFSAAALPKLDMSGAGVVGNLRRLNGHVSVTPLDSAKRPVGDLAALEVLATFPDEMLMPSSEDSSTSSAVKAAFGAIARTAQQQVPLGSTAGKRIVPAVVSFSHLFHRRSAPKQVGYVSDHSAFGWMWYMHEDYLIEGTHRASAALEVAPSVRYLKVTLRVIGDWRSHGAWQREMELVLDLGAGEEPVAKLP